MTDSELRIAVAKGEGLEVWVAKDGDWINTWRDYANGGELFYWSEKRDSNGQVSSMAQAIEVPDYPNDIREAYKLEDSVPEGERQEYIDNLIRVIGCVPPETDNYFMTAEGAFRLIHATARQKTEAYAIWKGVE
jgi:hypothetical protein